MPIMRSILLLVLLPLVAALRATPMGAMSRQALRTRIVTASALGETDEPQAFAEDAPAPAEPEGRSELHDMLASPFAGLNGLRDCLAASESDEDAEGCRLDYSSLFSDEALGWSM